MVTKPNKDMSVSNIVSQLDIWETFDGFVPDVVIIDYADILKGEPGDERKETRDQQNGTWQALRALSQKKHCLVITATQTDAAAYDTKDLKLKNFSEDKRKYSHVTVMPGLNQTEEEKDRGVMRVNILLAREEVFDIRRMVHVLQCLQIGRPFIASFRKKFKKKKEK